ncbi:ATP-binding protein [Haloplanus salinarum]|uniref:ATP-binding protein n=1 Tax=Haloplanus salinarum TaxID=1912324 RepID=UPI00214B0B51|nr:ATP-binding protein [Haloplanus salinarum]
MSDEQGSADERAVGDPVGGDFAGLLAKRSRRGWLTGGLEVPLGGLSVAWRRRLGSGVVAGVGLLLVGIPVYHLFSHGAAIESLLGDLLPLSFGATLMMTGAWLRWWNDDDTAPMVTAFWVLVGLVGAGLVALYVLIMHVGHGHVVQSPWFLAYDIAATGAVAGLLISRYDLRARTRHRRLSERERQFRAVFEGTLDALVVTDDRGRYVAANPAAADLFGLERSELIGKRVVDFTPEDVDVDEQWSAFLDEGSQRGEIELRRPDGEIRTVAFAATANVLPGRHLSALRDVTERTRREQELGEERARVEFLNRLLRHNILNGMNLVLAKLDVLAEDVPDGRREDVDMARHRSEEIVDLVQTARRLASDVTEASAERAIPVGDPLSAAIGTVRETYPRATVEWSPPDRPLRVRADDMLETVFDHLLTNAVEHNDTESVHVTVDVEADAETVTVRFADDGVGIPAERREQLFDGGGFSHGRDWGGFGLSIVDVLVDRYGGRVRTTENEPHGVVFHVELPRAAD